MNARTHLLHARLVFICLLVALSQNTENKRVSASSGTAASARPLVVGTTLSDAISAGEKRLYTLNVTAGEYARIELKRQDLQLTVSVCSNEGKPCRQTLGRRFGPLDLSFAAARSGTFTSCSASFNAAWLNTRMRSR